MVDPDELYWLKISAIGQVAGAGATAAAVIVSLIIAFAGRKPNLKIAVVESILFGSASTPNPRVITFRVINAGERPVHISGIGWRTGWIKRGPGPLKRQLASQVFSGPNFGKIPPYEIQPGEGVSSYALLMSVLDWAQKKTGEAFFSRNWPFFGMRSTNISGFVSTADGHTFYVRVDEALARKLRDAEFGNFPATVVLPK